jgi:hypothetical protein
MVLNKQSPRVLLVFLLIFILGLSSVLTPKRVEGTHSILSQKSLLVLSTLIYNNLDAYYGSHKKGGGVTKNAVRVSDMRLNDQSRYSNRPNFHYFIENHADTLIKMKMIDKNTKTYYSNYLNKKSLYNPPILNLFTFDTSELKQWELYDYLDFGDSLNRKGMFGAIFYNRTTKQYVVAFRGTTDKVKDGFMTDLKINKKEPFDIAQVKSAEQLLKKIDNFDKNKSNIVLTGHSLGGYLAEVLAVKHKIKAYTFNAPGIYKKSDFYKNYSSRTSYAKNYVFKDDPVGNNRVVPIPWLPDFDLTNNKYIGTVQSFSSSFSDSSRWKHHSIVYFYEFRNSLK